MDISSVGDTTVWEFSGQENYFPIYHHFLWPSPHSLTLVLFSLEDPPSIQVQQVCFWLNFLLARQPADLPSCKSLPVFVFERLIAVCSGVRSGAVGGDPRGPDSRGQDPKRGVDLSGRPEDSRDREEVGTARAQRDVERRHRRHERACVLRVQAAQVDDGGVEARVPPGICPNHGCPWCNVFPQDDHLTCKKGYDLVTSRVLKVFADTCLSGTSCRWHC
jgi:hypothetical protein